MIRPAAETEIVLYSNSGIVCHDGMKSANVGMLRPVVTDRRFQPCRPGHDDFR